MVALHDNSFSEHCHYFRKITSLQEEESKMKPGTNKEAIFKVLKEAGHEGFSLQQIVDTARTRGLKDFKDTQKNMIVTVHCLPS